ncbi:vacuolar protein sorting-associated protein 37A isoform X2 [Microcaecilia unicolor]|uniref:Vacuolar protein sorting-associated protein 37A n=1 Tax=Microcaecilia unicolor TaxID=1415580 RepID=A0A6P7X1R6_9AMPH|nr:vacuolar protein sorting-associated protein 37A isoform X2 [Microcaecilia unicolor]
MNWFFPVSKSSGPLSPLTSLQQQKQRQIDSLKAAHSSITEIQKDVEYRLPFTINNLTISINILLPPQFPQEKPVISVYPPIRHHIMDKQGEYVTSPLINNFTMHSDLGKIIQCVLDEFWKNPPVLIPGSTSFPYVSQLSDMNDQEDVLLKQFVNLPQLKQVITDKDNLVQSIEELAKKNLQLEPVLETKRQAVLDKYEQLLHMKAAFEKKMQRQHELSESCSASALQVRLKIAAHEAEEESDAIAEDFLEGKVEIDDFLSSFMEKRMSCHCRRAKEEKLQHLITMHNQYHALL